jgi:hypothetical protein
VRWLACGCRCRTHRCSCGLRRRPLHVDSGRRGSGLTAYTANLYYDEGNQLCLGLADQRSDHVHAVCGRDADDGLRRQRQRDHRRGVAEPQRSVSPDRPDQDVHDRRVSDELRLSRSRPGPLDPGRRGDLPAQRPRTQPAQRQRDRHVLHPRRVRHARVPPIGQHEGVLPVRRDSAR